MRNSFIFYDSWWIAIKNLPRDVQGDVLTAIIEYGLYGETTGQLKPIAKAMLAMVKAQIDINCQRFENGKKGGRPKGNKNQTETKPKPNNNQTETKPKPNVNDNVNVNDNDVIADAITTREDGSTVSGLEEIKAEINAAQAKAEGLCMSYGITPEEYEAIKAEIFAEWEMQGYSAGRQDAMNYFVNLMRIKAKDRQKQPKPPDIPLRDRQKALWNEIIGCGVQCPADTQKAFYAKWSETDASGRWMKCELENGFDVKRRLERYVINSDRQWR